MSGKVELRLARPEDAPAITDLVQAAYAPWAALIGRAPLPMTVNYAEAVDKHRFDLLEIDGALAALIETTLSDDRLLILNVAVAPRHQGLGLGARLMKHAEDLAIQARLAGVRLYTNQRFEKNIRLYAALGYRIDREEALNGGIAVHMSKDTGQAG
jgi:ribosomal protein S18 acetylase RimI-like enzyme